MEKLCVVRWSLVIIGVPLGKSFLKIYYIYNILTMCCKIYNTLLIPSSSSLYMSHYWASGTAWAVVLTGAQSGWELHTHHCFAGDVGLITMISFTEQLLEHLTKRDALACGYKYLRIIGDSQRSNRVLWITLVLFRKRDLLHRISSSFPPAVLDHRATVLVRLYTIKCT